MRKILRLTVFIALFALQFACSGQNVKQDENLVKASDSRPTTEYNPGTMDTRAVDESVETQWVNAESNVEGMQIISGNKILTGNEPFTYFALKVSDTEKYGLTGSKKLLEYLKNYRGELKVAGTIESSGKEKWIKVFYVIQGGK